MFEASQAVCVARGKAQQQCPQCCSELSCRDGSKLRTWHAVGAAAGPAGRHRSVTVCNTPECKVTTEVPHLDLDIKNYVLIRVISWLIPFHKSAGTK